METETCIVDKHVHGNGPAGSDFRVQPFGTVHLREVQHDFLDEYPMGCADLPGHRTEPGGISSHQVEIVSSGRELSGIAFADPA